MPSCNQTGMYMLCERHANTGVLHCTQPSTMHTQSAGYMQACQAQTVPHGIKVSKLCSVPQGTIRKHPGAVMSSTAFSKLIRRREPKLSPGSWASAKHTQAHLQHPAA